MNVSNISWTFKGSFPSPSAVLFVTDPPGRTYPNLDYTCGAVVKVVALPPYTVQRIVGSFSTQENTSSNNRADTIVDQLYLGVLRQEVHQV